MMGTTMTWFMGQEGPGEDKAPGRIRVRVRVRVRVLGF